MTAAITTRTLRKRARGGPTVMGVPRSAVLGTASFVVIIVAWQLVSTFELVSTFIVSRPSAVAQSLWEQLQSGQLVADLAVTFREFAAGFGLGTTFGLILGFACFYRFVEYVLDPWLWIAYSAPLIALFPVIILVIGRGTPAVIVLTTQVVTFAVALNAAAAIRDVRRDLVVAAKSFCASDAQVFRLVLLPAAVPMLGASIRLGIGRALIGVLVAEFFASDKGLGYRIAFYGHSFQMTQLLANVVVITLIGVTFSKIADAIERYAGRWRDQ